MIKLLKKKKGIATFTKIKSLLHCTAISSWDNSGSFKRMKHLKIFKRPLSFEFNSCFLLRWRLETIFRRIFIDIILIKINIIILRNHKNKPIYTDYKTNIYLKLEENSIYVTFRFLLFWLVERETNRLINIKLRSAIFFKFET